MNGKYKRKRKWKMASKWTKNERNGTKGWLKKKKKNSPEKENGTKMC